MAADIMYSIFFFFVILITVLPIDYFLSKHMDDF